MTTTAQMWYIQQKLDRYASDCRTSIHRVKHALTLRDVRDCNRVHADGVLSSLRHNVSEERQLLQACRTKATELVEKQLAYLEHLLHTTNQETWEKEKNRLRQQEWPFLRGEHGTLLHHIEQKLHQMDHTFKTTPEGLATLENSFNDSGPT